MGLYSAWPPTTLVTLEPLAASTSLMATDNLLSTYYVLATVLGSFLFHSNPFTGG